VTWPFARAFPEDQRRVVRRLGAELFER